MMAKIAICPNGASTSLSHGYCTNSDIEITDDSDPLRPFARANQRLLAAVTTKGTAGFMLALADRDHCGRPPRVLLCTEQVSRREG